MTILESDNVIFNLKPTAIETIDSVDYYKYTYNIPVNPSDATSPSFKYKEGKKPTTVAAYNAMTTALSSVTNAITFSGSVTFNVL
ncbi:MAG: hypothetical protein SOX92_05710 [Candidatus Onthovivens sp.]|nr:hypothetical protein [Candidatus Onthovivens sp.]MDY5891847.1 hypothetical protein [Candidatus Onthovivens sp.]